MDEYFACSVCGEDGGVARKRLVVAQAGWDRLRVMHWIAKQGRDALMACCPDHATQLVGQWLVTGNLMAPFARAVLGDEPSLPKVTIFHDGDHETICEFAADRESMDRVLADSPQFLDTMLSALCEAVGGETRAGFLNHREPAQTNGAMAAD
jgi:hypothetical protein